MTSVTPDAIIDVQNHQDDRQLAIHQVGVKSLRHPIHVLTSEGKLQPTIATFNMFVNLAPHKKGTHMSRFVELLQANDAPLSLIRFNALLQEMTHKLQAEAGYITVSFPFFIWKNAPVSGATSHLDYEITLKGEWSETSAKTELKVVVPVTSLCPCSKAISEYGAHNQRSHITLTVELNASVSIEELITLAEKHASCELYGILKRADEKYVTEKAYDNPKFVEDIVRDIASDLKKDLRIKHFKVESENFESIHNHSAYACLLG